VEELGIKESGLSLSICYCKKMFILALPEQEKMEQKYKYRTHLRAR